MEYANNTRNTKRCNNIQDNTQHRIHIPTKHSRNIRLQHRLLDTNKQTQQNKHHNNIQYNKHTKHRPTIRPNTKKSYSRNNHTNKPHKQLQPNMEQCKQRNNDSKHERQTTLHENHHHNRQNIPNNNHMHNTNNRNKQHKKL